MRKPIYLYRHEYSRDIHTTINGEGLSSAVDREQADAYLKQEARHFVEQMTEKWNMPLFGASFAWDEDNPETALRFRINAPGRWTKEAVDMFDADVTTFVYNLSETFNQQPFARTEDGSLALSGMKLNGITLKLEQYHDCIKGGEGDKFSSMDIRQEGEQLHYTIRYPKPYLAMGSKDALQQVQEEFVRQKSPYMVQSVNGDTVCTSIPLPETMKHAMHIIEAEPLLGMLEEAQTQINNEAFEDAVEDLTEQAENQMQQA